MKLSVDIHDIKSIKDFHIELPVESGLYAITGQNAAGKSTIVACAATAFFNMQMNDYFGRNVNNGGSITFEMEGAIRKWVYNNGWQKSSDNGKMRIKGYYEGSLIFGNRFRNTSYSSITKLDGINQADLVSAPEFIRKNLGYILHNNDKYYDHLYKIPKEIAHKKYYWNGEPYFYEKSGKQVAQIFMSTGENLLVSVLHSLNLRFESRADLNVPCFLFLDEIELALHPSSLSRLVEFLKKLSTEYNLAVYFSTHSIELIKDIAPDNIFFIERHSNDSLEIINPCYPSYATRILYDHSGYDYIILVEDDLAREIVYRLLRKYRLLNNKLVHVLPCGGWTNVLKLANEVIESRLISKPSSFIIILDGDIRIQADKYLVSNQQHFNVPLNYLPIESLEKYLRRILFANVNQKLFRLLDNYVFHKTSLTEITDIYKNSGKADDDKSGKELWKLIDTELKNQNYTRHELLNMIVEYIEENETEMIEQLRIFLEKNLQ
jgi:energy-coupling factor transporter ATP-binding protein EcfA2